MWRHGYELLGAARSFAEILTAVPDAEVVLVRMRGLWGSMFSFARTGRAPTLVGCLFRGIGIILANLFFFAPRRRVEITVERLDRSKLAGLKREQLNPALEAWYNAPGPEEPSHVPYHFLFGRRSFDFPKIAAEAEVDLSKVKPRTKDQVAQLIAEKLNGEEQSSVQDPATNLEQLGLDSLDRMELSLEVERRFGFTGAAVPVTVGDLWALAEGQLAGAPPAPVPAQWSRSAPAAQRPEILGETIPEAFVRQAIKSARQVACADDISGVLTYRRLLLGALLMSRRMAKMPGPNLGLMLPAGVAMNVLFYAAHLAGKLPVLMNWTTGPSNLAHAARVMGLSQIITSRRFIDRMGITVEGAKYVFVEDIRAGIGAMEKLMALLRVRFRGGSVLAATPRPSPDAPAVVLFTSGSEKRPRPCR